MFHSRMIINIRRMAVYVTVYSLCVCTFSKGVRMMYERKLLNSKTVGEVIWTKPVKIHRYKINISKTQTQIQTQI